MWGCFGCITKITTRSVVMMRSWITTRCIIVMMMIRARSAIVIIRDIIIVTCCLYDNLLDDKSNWKGEQERQSKFGSFLRKFIKFTEISEKRHFRMSLGNKIFYGQSGKFVHEPTCLLAVCTNLLCWIKCRFRSQRLLKIVFPVELQVFCFSLLLVDIWF